MGTLGSQPARRHFEYSLEDFVNHFKEVAAQTGVQLEFVIEAEKTRQMARQNALMIEDGDFRDEQMGGIGERLREIAHAIESMKDED